MNSLIRRVKKIAQNPRYLITLACKKGLFDCLSDESYMKLNYWASMKKRLNLKNPETFNEKMQWLLLNYRNPYYSRLVDKYEVKAIVSEIIGSQYVIPTYCVWDSIDDVDITQLPECFVLKCTHDSGSVVICKDKSKFDFDAAKKKLTRCMNENFYRFGREWYYKDIKPRIIAEKYMEDNKWGELRDYKFFTFNGIAKLMFVACDRFTDSKETTFDFFDMDYNHLPVQHLHPNATKVPEKPINFELMRVLAEKLSVGIPQVRIDFYEVNGSVFFGEYTFSNSGAAVPFEPEAWDKTIGDWIELPSKMI